MSNAEHLYILPLINISTNTIHFGSSSTLPPLSRFHRLIARINNINK